MATQVVVRGTVTADGTLQLDEPVGLPPGPVEVRLIPQPATRREAMATWWQVLQQIRADREARGYPFMNETEVTAHIAELRADDRPDRLASPDDSRG